MSIVVKIAEEGYRPPIREMWNPAMSLLITSCWCDDPSLRPSLGNVMSTLATIMDSCDGWITSLEAVVDSMATTTMSMTVTDKKPPPSSSSSSGDAAINLLPGEPWRRVQIQPSHIVIAEVLGSGSYSEVHRCTFQGKDAALKVFRNTSEEKAVGLVCFRPCSYTFLS